MRHVITHGNATGHPKTVVDESNAFDDEVLTWLASVRKYVNETGG